jgi:hypothetical protein
MYQDEIYQDDELETAPAPLVPPIKSIYIPAGRYVSKAQAAELLAVATTTLQYHIGKGDMPTIHFPGLGHLIKEEDVLNFRPKSKGRPTIYKKY